MPRLIYHVEYRARSLLIGGPPFVTEDQFLDAVREVYACVLKTWKEGDRSGPRHRLEFGLDGVHIYVIEEGP